MTKAQVTITREIIDEEYPDASYLEQEGFEDRLAAFIRGEFGFVGVRAVAKIELRAWRGADRIMTTIASPGLWGIESDSGEDYFETVFQEEKTTLLDMLASLHEFELA